MSVISSNVSEKYTAAHQPNTGGLCAAVNKGLSDRNEHEYYFRRRIADISQGDAGL